MSDQETRLERFRKVCEECLGEIPHEHGPWHTTGDEDAAEYIWPDDNGNTKTLARYCLVTVGGEFMYVYPEADTLDDAAVLAEEKVDPSYGEGPWKVVDLDTGKEYKPQWETLRWV